MNDFLNRVVFDNSILDYLIVAGIIFLVFIIKKYVAHYVAGLLYRLISMRWKTIDKASFKNLVAKPLGLFLAVFVTVAALDQLVFPAVLDFKIYHIPIQELLRMTGTTLLIVTFFLFLIKCIDFIVLVIKERYVKAGDPTNHQLIFFFKDFIKVIIGCIGILLILKYVLNYDVKGLVTGLSIVGAAIAFALKESLENLIASFIIFFDKPFTTGDAVKVNNVSGVIERIGLRSTRIRSDAKTYITMPNKQMVDSVLDNLSDRTQRRADLKLEINSSTPPQKVQQFVDGIREILRKKEIESFSLYLNDITAASLLITGEYYTGPNDIAAFNTIKQKVNMEILQLLDSLDIQVAGKVTDVKIVQPNIT